MIEFWSKRKLLSWGPSFWLALSPWPCALSHPHARISHREALVPRSLPDLRVVSFSLSTWLSHPSSGTRNSRSPVWKLEAESHAGKGTLWLTCTFHVSAANPLFLYSLQGREIPEYSQCLRKSGCMPSRQKSSFTTGFPTPKRQGDEVAVSLNVCIGSLDLTFWRKGTEYTKSEFSQEILSEWSGAARTVTSWSRSWGESDLIANLLGFALIPSRKEAALPGISWSLIFFP